MVKDAVKQASDILNVFGTHVKLGKDNYKYTYVQQNHKEPQARPLALPSGGPDYLDDPPDPIRNQNDRPSNPFI